MVDANLILQHTFEGEGYPTWAVEWPSFSWPDGNRTGVSRPVVDGHGRGIGSRAVAPGTSRPWVAKSLYRVGRADYKADLTARWKAPGTSGRREVGLIVRLYDYNNYIVARVRSMPGTGPELRLFKRVAGIETQLGSTYTGTHVGESSLFGDLKYRVRVEDVASGVSVKVYTGAITSSSNGTLRIDETTDEPTLRGDLPVGIELRDFTFNDDIAIAGLDVYDLADEWTSSVTPDADASWQVEIGNDLYTRAELAALSPPVKFLTFTHGYKLGTAEAVFSVEGTTAPSTLFIPNRPVRIYEGGRLRFRGFVAEGDIKSSNATQTFICRGFEWAANKVYLEEDDLTGTHHFNVYAPDAGDSGACTTAKEEDVPDNYDPSRQDMTVGDIIKWLFDRYVDRTGGLRHFKACAPQETPYVQSELDGMTAKYTDLAISGNFYTAIQTLVRLQPNYQVYLDPDTQIWHFRDVTELIEEDLALTDSTERVNYSVKPDPDKSYTYFIARGSKKSEKEKEELSLYNGDLSPIWLPQQETTAIMEKGNISGVFVTVVSAGTLTNFTYNGKTHLLLDYIDISSTEAAQKNIDPDEFRGGITTIGGHMRFCIGHTSTRFYFSAPAWSSPPAVGTTISISLTDPCAAEALSAMGVGRGYILMRPSTVCGILEDAYGSVSYRQSMKNKGFCGKARVAFKNADGKEYSQYYDYRLRFLTAEAQAAFGVCGPIVMLSRPPVIPIDFTVHPPPPSVLSPPTVPMDVCKAPPSTAVGNKNPAFDLKITLSEYSEEAAFLREPAEGFRGPAYSEDQNVWDGDGQADPEAGDWGVENPYIHDDPDFKDVDLQGPGLRAAGAAILAQFGQKAYSMSVEFATPWEGRSIRSTWSADIDRFFDMDRRLTLSSTRRVTGFESSANKNLPVYKIVYDITANKTTLYAGTSNAWAEVDPQTFIRMHVDRNLMKKVAAMAAEMKAFKEALIAHREDLVGATPATVPGCQVTYQNTTTRKVTNIQQVLPQKDNKIHQLSLADKLGGELLRGVQADFAGAPIAVPGLHTDAARMPIRSAQVLEYVAKHDVMDQGPSDNAKVNANRGKYGGLTGMESQDAGDPSVVLLRAGNYAFRAAPDGNGAPYGGDRIEFSRLDRNGEPTTWTPFLGPTSLPGGHVPLDTITDGSLLHTILARIESLEKVVGTNVDTVTEKAIAPGDTDQEETQFPDGAPPDLLTSLAVFSGMEGMRLLHNTIADPGGAVFKGPMNDDGVDAGMYWRAIMPERVAIQVENVGTGSGTNGGSWAPVDSGNGEAYVFVSSARIVHKQVHAAELDSDSSCPACVEHEVTDDSDFGFANARGVAFDASSKSGAGAIFPLPVGAVGEVVVEAIIAEHPDDPLGVGEVLAVRAKTQFKGSAWSAVENTDTKPSVTGDGGGEGVGQFKAPGGSVPPGLRKPTGMAVSIERDPGNNGDTSSGKRGTILGVGINVAVIDGGYLIRIRRDRIGAIDVLAHTMPGFIEACANDEAFALEFGKNLEEEATARDWVEVLLNPPIALYERATVRDTFTVQLV